STRRFVISRRDGRECSNCRIASDLLNPMPSFSGLIVFGFGAIAVFASARAAEMHFGIRESDSALPARVHLRDEKGTAVRAPVLPFLRDHFVCAGDVTLKLSPGRYEYDIERGPEYPAATGSFSLGSESDNTGVKVSLDRLVNLAAEGWWSGELHVHRPLPE